MKRARLTTAERLDWLRLTRAQGVGPITFFQLLERFGSAAAAIEALPALITRTGARRDFTLPPRNLVQQEINRAELLGARFLAACEPDYPPALAAIDAPPPLIAVRGDVKLLHRPAIALVGARNASAVGRKMARDLAADLGAAGWVIVSGLARGVDGEAHRAAMQNGTAAVLAGGVDQIYPPEHADLYGDIVHRGAAVSEMPIGYIAMARDFPKRNRIISGLSMATVVVEAAERSGSLITARTALEQGREVMAVPGSPLDARARGANRLIKQGAALIESADDVLRALEGLHPPAFDEPPGDRYAAAPMRDGPPPALLRAVKEALSPTPLHVDEIARAVDAPASIVRAALAELELSGEATTHVGGMASRAV